jgi:nucleotide-binding universal stress UspA family protein
MVYSTNQNTTPGLEIKRILVPTDFSECSRTAIVYAAELARIYQAKIFLLHVVESSVYSLDTSLIPPGDPFGLREKLVEMTEKEAALIRKSGFDAEGECVIGLPAIEIVRAVQEKKADLVVMGTHGRTGLSHILLGSTAERVIQRAPCPVLTVKAEMKGAAASGSWTEDQLEEKRRAVKELAPQGAKGAYCHLCGQPAHDIICDACKIRVQTEAFDHKQRIEKEGRVDTGRR